MDDLKAYSEVEYQNRILKLEYEVARVKADLQDARQAAKAAIMYIDAIPEHIEFTCSMPGFDRDWFDECIKDKE